MVEKYPKNGEGCGSSGGMESVLPCSNGGGDLEDNHADETGKDQGSSGQFVNQEGANRREDEVDCSGTNVDT